MNESGTYWYSVGNSSTRYCLETNWHDVDDPVVRRWLVDECAEDYHSNHDGWEDSWPLTITLWESESSNNGWSFEVEREMAPEFHVSTNETRVKKRPHTKPSGEQSK